MVYALRNAGPALIIGPGAHRRDLGLRAGVPRVVGVEVNPLIADDVMRARSPTGTATSTAIRASTSSSTRGAASSGARTSATRRSRRPGRHLGGVVVGRVRAVGEQPLHRRAFEEFVDHLQDGGVLAVTRWYDAREPAQFSAGRARRAALEARGVTDAWRHVILIATREARRAARCCCRATRSPRRTSRP